MRSVRPGNDIESFSLSRNTAYVYPSEVHSPNDLRRTDVVNYFIVSRTHSGKTRRCAGIIVDGGKIDNKHSKNNSSFE